MRRLAAFAVVGAAAVVVGLGAGILLRGGEVAPAPRTPDLAEQSGLQVTASTPAVQSFGEPIVATVVVRLNPAVINVDRVRSEADFTPYERVGAPTIERIRSGEQARVVFRYPLRCLGEGCEPTKLSGVLVFPEGRIRYHYLADETGRGGVAPIEWPGFTVSGRVSDEAATNIAWRAEPTELAAVSYRSGPRRLAVGLFALAVLLAAAAAALAWALWGGRRAAERDDAGHALTPLAALLGAARAAASNGDLPLRRRALEGVARELGRLGLGDLAADARVLAWSQHDPSAEDVEALARRSELAAGGVA